MNFLLRSSTQTNPPAADAPASTAADADRDQKPILHSISFNSLHPVPTPDFGMGDDLRGVGEFGSVFTRMPIEDHYDLPPDAGAILVPFPEFPENWSSAPDVASLKFLDRDFIFPGEQLHILVHVRAEDPAGPDILTPFKVAAAMNKLAAKKAREAASEASEGDEAAEGGGTAPVYGESLPEELEKAEWELKSGEVSGIKKFSPANLSAEYASSPTTLLQQEGKKKRTLALLDSFRKSHYYVHIVEEDQPLWKKRSVRGVDASLPGVEGSGAPDEQSKAGTHGCTPVPMETGTFDPHSAGGLARRAVACNLLENGDIVVLLQVTMSADCIDDAFLEVLQYKRFESSGSGSFRGSHAQHLLGRCSWDPTQGLLQWLLPLDRPSSPPPSVGGPIQASPPMVTLPAPNSNIFSFGHLRTSSAGSMPPLQAQPLPSSTATHAQPPIYGSKVWDSVLQERSNKGDPGSAGLLSFRGAVLEPQRFAAHCGLEGPHVPGKRWRRKLSIVQPIKVESYFAHCNTQDLICVLVENILPPTGKTADVVIFVDSVSIVCHSVGPGSPPVAVPISCVEVGDDSELPGLALRVGEQHSFILRPTSPTWNPSPGDDNKRSSTAASGPGREQQTLDASHARKKSIKDSMLSSSVGEQYAVIVSCRCSHTESRLQYKHTLQWRPRLPRDLLVSVNLESSPPLDAVNAKQPLFKTQVVTVQATNLTAQNMNLTLLAPSSLANSPLSMVSFPVPLADSPITGQSFTLNEDRAGGNEQESEPTSPADQQLTSQSESSSLPPVQSIESVIGVSPVLFRERNISAADIVADNSPARTHLWMQSVVPLGCIPAFSTTAVKCDVLPLVDGIITLDTLHLSTNEHDALYIPESPLQIYTTSSIATGVP